MASIDLNTLPSDGKTITVFDPAAAAEELRIDPFRDVPEPPAVLKVIEGSEVIPSFTRGNFSLIMGKAKSRKTFFCVMLVSSFIARNNEKFKAIPENKPKVLWFDTEQSEYHLHKTMKRIRDIVGDAAIMNVDMFALRTKNTSERKIFIDYQVKNNPSAGLIIIDGIRDLVNDINSAQESTDMATTLLQWTAQQDTHIINVLHQNKADNNARGHLGTELTNKAEIVLSVVAEGIISTVNVEYSREMSFAPFSFRITEASLPELCERQTKSEETKACTNPNLIPDENHIQILGKLFRKAGMDLPSYSELQDYLTYSFRIGETKSRSFISHYLLKGWISKTRSGKKVVYKYERALH